MSDHHTCGNFTVEPNAYNLFKKPLDWIVLIVYFIGLLAIGLWVRLYFLVKHTATEHIAMNPQVFVN